MNEDLRTLMRTAINLALPILTDERASIFFDPHEMRRLTCDQFDRAIDYCERAIVADGKQP